MAFRFSQNETNNILKHFGQVFYDRVVNCLEVYSIKWKLDIEEFIDYYSVNCIFICRSEIYGPAVLKIGNPSNEVCTEVNLLKEYNGSCFCRVFDWDVDNGVILEERINPGIRLREEQSLEKRLSVFSNLFNGLHIQSYKSELYPTYYGWVSRISEYMSKREDYKELYKLMLKAKDMCASLSVDFSRKMLLHGDLHHDNILLGVNDKYRIIDPKGVVGDPIFDIPRFILNEFYGKDYVSYDFYSKHIEKLICYFQKSLNVPIDIIKKCIFIEMTMANCWNVESNEEPEIHYVLYSETMIN